MLRSAVFTCLLEWPEFARMEMRLAGPVITELTAEVERRWAAGETTSAWDIYLEYRASIGEGQLDAHAHTLTNTVA